jgi:hypothetical protein
MWTRVTNPRQRSFKDYGARGITVCPEWKSFERFLADMGERPSGLTLERCRVNEGYRPDNCYWADGETQGNNRQAQRKYFVDGRWYGLLQLSRYWGLNPYQTRKRISNSSIKDNTGGVYGLALDAQAERHEGR